MAEVQLTASMRSNLLALQQTTELLGKTQERLSSGKKVNSALDNPTNFFAAQSLTSRANDLLGFKDAISQAIQTINAADKSISAIKTLIESAKAVANDAKGVVAENQTSQTLTISSASSLSATDTVVIDGVTFTAIEGAASATQFDISSNDATQIAINLASAINSTSTTHDATVSSNVLTITAAEAGVTMVAADIQFSATDLSTMFAESAIGGGSTELTAKIAQYDSLMTQLGTLQDDAFYAGKNLLDDENMTVKFGNDHTLAVNGFDATVSGLALSATASWGSETEIDADITLMDTALDTLKVEAGSLASNLSIVNARDSWISDISSVLQTGADKLTLADSNEEGANMLMLQTRQALGVTSLSLASQQAQSVLRLFG